MRPAVRWGLGLGCFAAALAVGALVPAPPSDDPGAALGGARPVLSGALFLRAEALRREGRSDEVAATYRRILEVDPGNDAARDLLVEILVTEVRELAPTPEGRVRWWREGLRLVEEGLARDPGSVRLHWRRADLLLGVADRDPAVGAACDAEGRDRAADGFASLREAVRRAGSVPGHGRIHLEAVTLRAPLEAARRWAAGGDPAPFLDAGAEALALRPDDLSLLLLDPDRPVTAALALQGGLRLVARVRDAMAAVPPRRDEARALLDAYESVLGADPVASALAPRVR
jgi:hypothetical protein